MITIVTGLGRCGTSLTMQMLAAAGMPVTGPWPSYELEAANEQFNAEWVRQQKGAAVKILDLHRTNRALIHANYRFIFCVREHTEQAKSIIKLASTLEGMDFTREQRYACVKDLMVDQRRALARAKQFGRVMCVQFEALLTRPRHEALRIAQFVGLPTGGYTVNAMVDCILPRGKKCMPDLSIENELSKRSKDNAEKTGL